MQSDGHTGTAASARATLARLWLTRFALALPALAILTAAVPRLVSGLAQETAFPATAYIAMNVALPPPSYNATAQVLSHAPLADGETQIARAEAANRVHEPAGVTIPVVKAALTHAPASARGWILFAELLRQRDPKEGAAALSLAIELAPHEYYLISPRVQAGAPLWNYLPQDARETLLDDTHLLIANSEFHQTLRALLRAPGGPALVTRALAGHPDELRALNRSLARERLGF